MRLSVFVHEQHIDESEEWDESDAVSLHGVAWLGGKVVGCIRLLPEGKLGRLAVLKPYRRQKVASALLGCAIEKAVEAGHKQLLLSAQTSAMALYKEFGFEPFGPPHVEVNIPHQWMKLDLSNRPSE
ncbi:MAG: GNAT family N-acetyltransferase [Limnobacter sp.]|nr:GNAT family N-acetyltransferase [Limnobacter sp.]